MTCRLGSMTILIRRRTGAAVRMALMRDSACRRFRVDSAIILGGVSRGRSRRSALPVIDPELYRLRRSVLIRI